MKKEQVRYGITQTPYGQSLIALKGSVLVAFLFIEFNSEKMLSAFKSKFPGAILDETYNFFPIISDILSNKTVHFELHGTPFQKGVWMELQKLHDIISYKELASRINKPKAVRAVASAVAANMLHYIIPCHLIIRNDGSTGEYAGGPDLKRRLIAAHENTMI